MKVLLVHKFFTIIGGAEVFFFEVGRVLEKNGHKVAYFSTIDAQNKPSYYSKYFVRAPEYRSDNPLKSMKSIVKIIYSLEAKKKFRQILLDFKPDVVHVFAIFTHISLSILDVCHEMGVPVVMSCNDYKHICPNSKLFHHGRLCEDCKNAKFYNAILTKCCQNSLVFSMGSSLEAYVHHTFNLLRKNVHTFLFASEFMAKKTEEFWGTNTFRWRKLQNPFDSSNYLPSQEYSNYFLFVGRLVEEKGVDILLKAMENLPKVNLILVGDGPDIDRLKKVAKKSRFKNIKFVGPKWGEALDLLLRKARFTVVPSIWHENFPYVILQSFVAGKAVIGTDRGGIPELIRDGEFGLIYAAQDHKMLAESIEYLWEKPQLAFEMGKAAREYVVTEFSDQKFYENLVEIYKDVLK